MARVLSTRYIEDYPTLYSVLTTAIPPLPRVQPHVFRTFAKYTKMSESDAHFALRYGSLPVIRVADLRKPKYANYPGSGDVITIQHSFMLDVESAIAAGFTRVLRLLESKILHEMVHWGWFSSTLRRTEPPSRNSDYAWDFEEDAWGKPLTVQSMGLAHVIPDPLIPWRIRIAVP